MKKFISLLMALIMLISCTSGIQLSASAADYTTLATDIPLNGQWSGDYWLTETNKEQWFRIVIPGDGHVSVKVMSYTGRTYLDLFNYDLSEEYTSDYWRVDGGSEASPKTGTYEADFSAGVYYIKISGNTGKYKLTGNFVSFNVNDNGAQSYDSPFLLNSNYTVTGAITQTDTQDWYKIQIPSNGRYVVKLVSYTGRTYLDVFNYDLSEEYTSDYWRIDGGSEASPKTGTYEADFSAGVYYIKITGSTGKYQLSWYALTPENCTHDFETKSVGSTCTAAGYTTYTCKICGYSYNADYKALSSHYYSTTTVYPTYTSKGYTTHVCRNCGYSYKDNYTAKLKVKKPSISSLKKGKKKLTVYLKNYSGLDGVQIQYSTSKKFTKKKTKTVATKKASKTIKKLKSKKKYYVRVRGYKIVNGKKVYSSWSKVKSIKVK